MAESRSPPGAIVDTDVLVVGAGPIGLTATCELLRRGLRVRVIDRKAEPSAYSKALAVHARTLELFEKIGIAEELVAAGTRVGAVNIRDRKRLLTRIAVPPVDTPYPFVLSVPQSQTERTLLRALDRYGGRVEWSTTFEGFGSSSETVVAHLKTAGGKALKSRSAWVLGCDGAESTVRHALSLSFAGERFPEWFALADVEVDDALLERELPRRAWREAHGCFSSNGVLVLIPLSGERRFRIVLTLPEQPIEEEPHLNPELFQRELLDRAGLDLRVVEFLWTSAFRIHRRMVSHYRRGHVFLAGDAAHVHSPVGGQGMNLGIQDAFNLAWKLALVHSGHGGSKLLDSYQAERQPPARSTLSATGLATWIVTLRRTPARWLRNKLISHLVGRRFIRRRIVRLATMIDLQYRRSPLAVEVVPSRLRAVLHTIIGRRPGLAERSAFARGPRAGERAPDAALYGDVRERHRVFDLLHGTGHVLLIFAGRNSMEQDVSALRSSIGEALHRFPDMLEVYWIYLTAAPNRVHIRSLLEDRNGEVHMAYGAAAPCLYLVRPDGYIGWRGMAVAAPLLIGHLEGYLKRR